MLLIFSSAGTKLPAAKADQVTHQVFYEDFVELTEGSVGVQLTQEGANNFWGVVAAGDNNILWSDYLNIPYLDNANNSVVSNTINLGIDPTVTSNIIFNMSCDTELRTDTWKDYVSLNVYDGNAWTEINKYDETLFGDEEFHNVSENVSAYNNTNFKFKFTWVTNTINNDHMGCSIWPIEIKQSIESATLLAPTGVSLTADSSTQLTAHWTNNATSETGYKVYLAPTPNTDCSSATYAGTPDYTTAADAISQPAAGLSVNSRYCAKVVATDGTYVTSPGFATSPAYTLADTPLAPTVNNTNLATSLTDIINMSTNPGATKFALACNDDATFLNYTTKACEAISDDTDHWRTYLNWGGGGGFTVTGLSANTNHTYKVMARNGEGTNTALSAGSSRYTLANIPAVPTVNNTDITTTLTATIDPNNNPADTNFAIYETSTAKYVQADGSLNTAAVWQDFTAWDDTSGATVIDLLANTNYIFKVKAQNGDGAATNFSSVASKYTLIETPTGITFDAVHNTSIVMSATSTPSNLSIGLSGLQFSETSGNPGGGGQIGFSSLWTQTNSVTDLDLTKNTAYTYKVRARNGDGVATADSAPDAEQTTTNYSAPVLSLITPDSSIVLDNFVNVAYFCDGEIKTQRFTNLNAGENALQIIEANVSDAEVTANLNFTVIYKPPLNLQRQSFAAGWNLVSFPDGGAITNKTLLPDSFKLRQYLIASNNYLKGETNTISLSAGKGFWMKINSLSGIESLRYALETKSQVTTSLNSGWNLLGNPFRSNLLITNLSFKHRNDSSISFAEAVNRNEVAGYAWVYENTASPKQYYLITANPDRYKTSAIKKTYIAPFRGFWFFVRSSQINSVTMNK